MVQKINITIDEWLFDVIERNRGSKNRSEYVSELITKGLGFHEEQEVSS